MRGDRPRALDAGINFIDTADVYSSGESEEIVGKALAGRRDDVVLATKVHGPAMWGADPNRAGNSRRWIVRACEDSLRRLRTDIDLYQSTDRTATAIDETLSALSDLVHAGKVRYLGSSTFPPSEIVEAQWAAERRNLERFVREQPPYSLLVRGVEATCCRAGATGWRDPLEPAGGRLAAGPLPPGRGPPDQPRPSGCPGATTCRCPATSARLEAADALGGWRTRPASASCTSPSPGSWPSGGDRRHHRPSHDGAVQEPDRRGRRDAATDVLDRIDEIVPPGLDSVSGERRFTPPAVADASLRRRPSGLA